jgi:hypothetical protein
MVIVVQCVSLLLSLEGKEPCGIDSSIRCVAAHAG